MMLWTNKEKLHMKKDIKVRKIEEYDDFLTRREVKDVMKYLLVSLSKVRSYTLSDVLTKWVEGEIDDVRVKELLDEWNQNFNTLDVDLETKESILYTDFIEIGSINITIRSIYRIQPLDRYSFKHNKMQYGILLNKSENENIPNANEFIIFDTEEDRDKQLLLLKDRLALFQIRFN